MTRSLDRLIAKTPSSVSMELLTLPVRGQLINSPMNIPYVAGSVNTDTSSVYARSAIMMEDTLKTVSLELWKIGRKTQSQITESTRKVGIVRQRLLARMTDDAGPFQYACHAWIHGHMSFNSLDPDESPCNKASNVPLRASL